MRLRATSPQDRWRTPTEGSTYQRATCLTNIRTRYRQDANMIRTWRQQDSMPPTWPQGGCKMLYKYVPNVRTVWGMKYCLPARYQQDTRILTSKISTRYCQRDTATVVTYHSHSGNMTTVGVLKHIDQPDVNKIRTRYRQLSTCYFHCGNVTTVWALKQLFQTSIMTSQMSTRYTHNLIYDAINKRMLSSSLHGISYPLPITTTVSCSPSADMLTAPVVGCRRIHDLLPSCWWWPRSADSSSTAKRTANGNTRGQLNDR